jgi:hypothetical protein
MALLTPKVKIKFIALLNAGLKQLNKRLYKDIKSPSLKSELARIGFVLAVVVSILAFIMTILFATIAWLIIKG